MCFTVQQPIYNKHKASISPVWVQQLAQIQIQSQSQSYFAIDSLSVSTFCCQAHSETYDQIARFLIFI
jgi:hypothetical protein